jgi:hypothetical protein
MISGLNDLIQGGKMKVAVICGVCLVLTGMALGADEATREKLSGQWQQTDGVDKATLTIKDSGDSIHVTSAGEPQAAEDFECNTAGKECAVKVAGHKSKVSMWFNGQTLVELQTTGSDVVKRQFKVTGDGDTMEMETKAISPAGKDETTHFKRITAVASK